MTIRRQRGLAALLCLGLLATSALGTACAVDEVQAISSVEAEVGPPTDPNAADPDYGAPKRKLAANPTGWGSNQNGKQFPHYGRIEIKLCDLPKDFTTWTEGRQRKWCRAELVRQGHAMPSSYTNHELVETRGNQKYLAVYKVNKKDHSSSGRPRLYHPPDPNRGGKAYRGGIAQLRDVPGHHFKKKKPPRKPRPRPRRSAAGIDVGDGVSDDAGVCGDECSFCTECAATPEEAGDICGETCPL